MTWLSRQSPSQFGLKTSSDPLHCNKLCQTFQAPSAQVPDQEHPEKYMNFDTAWLDTVVHHNLWYKDTKAFKHHKHGEKKKVIPHLHPHHPA